MKSVLTKISIISLIVLTLFSCAHKIKKDPLPNPSLSGFHRMEFDVKYGEEEKKEIGIGDTSTCPSTKPSTIDLILISFIEQYSPLFHPMKED